MSFGLFADLANASGRFADLDNTPKSADKAHWFKNAGDPWDGPRVWTIAGGKFGPNPDWLFKVPQKPAANSYYPNAALPEPPGPDMPLQQVSPWSAIYISRLLGCRLPTTEEWTAAYKQFEVPALTKDAWNLRGTAWLAQQNFSRQESTNGMAFPDAGMFNIPDLMFAGVTSENAVPWKTSDLQKILPNRASPATDAADTYKGSTIWFRKVGTQPGLAPPNTGTGAMHDLVGNVAEYVFDADTATAVIKDAQPTVAAVDALLPTNGTDPGTLGVIGGSSLSPPQLPFDKKQPLDPNSAQSPNGFSDVGFRLAYTAPIATINEVLATVFKDPKYLPVTRTK